MTPDTALVVEWTSVAGNILFTYLIGREVRVGWLLGFFASTLGILLYAEQSAWLMAALNGFYAAMGLYGWWSWGRASEDQAITSMTWRMHAWTLGIGLAVTAALVWVMQAIGLEGEHQWMEAFITAFALLATWLMSKKWLENWIYWTVGDLVAVYYNHLMELNGYALLMVVYILLAVVGFLRWRKQIAVGGLQLEASK